MADEMKVRITDLGWAMARGRNVNPYLYIVTPTEMDDNGNTPAQSIYLGRRQDIVALRDLCNFVLGEEAKA